MAPPSCSKLAPNCSSVPSDVSIRRALILSLGEYAESRLSAIEREGRRRNCSTSTAMILIPASTGRRNGCCVNGGMRIKSKAIDKELGKLPLPMLRMDQGEASSKGNNRRWYINSQGQTMVIVPGPVEFEMGESKTQHRERIGHSFAIASKEVTVEQFETFLKENPRVQVKNEEHL